MCSRLSKQAFNRINFNSVWINIFEKYICTKNITFLIIYNSGVASLKVATEHYIALRVLKNPTILSKVMIFMLTLLLIRWANFCPFATSTLVEIFEVILALRSVFYPKYLLLSLLVICAHCFGTS